MGQGFRLSVAYWTGSESVFFPRGVRVCEGIPLHHQLDLHSIHGDMQVRIGVYVVRGMWFSCAADREIQVLEDCHFPGILLELPCSVPIHSILTQSFP